MVISIEHLNNNPVYGIGFTSSSQYDLGRYSWLRAILLDDSPVSASFETGYSGNLLNRSAVGCQLWRPLAGSRMVGWQALNGHAAAQVRLRLKGILVAPSCGPVRS